MLLVLLLTVLILSTTSKAQERDIRKISLSDLSILETEASKTSIQFYELPKGWNVINTNFMDKMNLKLNECKARKEIVEVIKDRIIEKPTPISWYQEPIIMAYGVPVVFSTGLILGIILTK